VTFCVQAGWDDVPHLSAAQKTEMLKSYPEHERDARARGIPMLGSGAVFPIDEARIKCAPIEIPRHWPQIVGLDFGWDHPTAAARMAWDRDNDCIYVTACYRRSKEIPAVHAAAIKPWGKWIPVAWPHDGEQHDKGSGIQLAEQYRQQDLNMLAEKATNAEGGNGVEAGIMDMLERMRTERFKVFAGLNDWFQEFRMYHRKDGKIVALIDDLMSATRYGCMMRRFAETEPQAWSSAPARAGADWMGA
jgi:hypothetical protein